MHILICTYGRMTPTQQVTLQNLNAARYQPTLVVQERELNSMMRIGDMSFDTYCLPDTCRTISHTRDHLIHKAVLPYQKDDKILMLDDDLDFAVRRLDDPTRFHNMAPHDYKAMFDTISRQLDVYPMVGIAPREGGNRNTEEFMYNTRIMRGLGFRRDYLREHAIFFSGVELMEDFHVNLQILRSGADTCVVNNWVQNQRGGSNAPGGCSSYRTQALQTAAANKLAGLHPGFVKVLQKRSLNWGEGVETRTDVMVYWKKARASAEALK